MNDESKKKQSLHKNKDDSKKILDELIKKSVNRLFWEDIERPLPKYYFDPNENPYLNNIFKKGLFLMFYFKILISLMRGYKVSCVWKTTLGHCVRNAMRVME